MHKSGFFCWLSISLLTWKCFAAFLIPSSLSKFWDFAICDCREPVLNKTQQRSYVEDTWPGKDQEILNTSTYYSIPGNLFWYMVQATMNYIEYNSVGNTPRISVKRWDSVVHVVSLYCKNSTYLHSSPLLQRSHLSQMPPAMWTWPESTDTRWRNYY